MDRLIKLMKIAFASEYAFVLKAQNFHWNVEGIHFEQFHALFQTIYQEVYGAIDPFAENIRKLGAYAPAGLERFSMLSRISDSNTVLTAEQMVETLVSDSDKMAKIFAMVYKEAENLGEFGLANFLAERQDAHQKHSWMLRVTLK